MTREVILMVGSMGSGKTTYVKNNLKDYIRISQDEMGKKEHFQKFLEEIKKKEKNIVIDRINHLRKQRKKYLEVAKRNNYKTRILVINERFKTCFDRITKREDHPNLNSDTAEKTILKALEMYNREYEYPTEDEADEVEFLTNYDPYMQDISHYKKFIIVGDVHGCFDELEELYEKIKGEITKDTAIVFVGDLFDKGPKSKEVWEFFKSLKNVYCVKGNHELKLIRYLRGGSVSISYGLDKTLDAFDLIENPNSEENRELLFRLEEMPLILKLSDNDYVIHAGLHPKIPIEKQPKKWLLFARSFNPKTEDYNNENDNPWFMYRKNSDPNIYFGHNFHEKVKVNSNSYSLDGYCVYGKEIRSLVFDKENDTRKVVKVKARKMYFANSYIGWQTSLEPFEDLVSQGYLSKSENENLVLYNYTSKCVYEKYWNAITKISRGIIFDKKEGNCVARPFQKFFNVDETPQTQKHKLPLKLDHWVYEKLDGTLGILYFYKGKWHISTRGAIKSEQSIRAEEIFNKKYSTKTLRENKTYLVEIIYPENKHIVDYKDKEDLVLLGAIDNVKGKEVPYIYLVKISKATKMPLVKRTNLNFEKALKKEIGKNEEGFVVYFSNGLRVKIKGKEYLKLSKLKNNFSVKHMIEVLSDGKIADNYMQAIEEEFLDEAEKIREKIEIEYLRLEMEIAQEIEELSNIFKKPIEKIDRKELISKLDSPKFKHRKAILDIINSKKDKLEDYIKAQISISNQRE